MSVSHALATPVDEIMESTELVHTQWVSPGAPMPNLPQRQHAPKGQPDVGSGSPYAGIVRALAADNAELDKRDQVTVDSVRNHCGRHFPVQNVARATYREIVERRAKENGVDFVEGVATALTPLEFFETVMVKSYETLVDSNTKVDVNTGILAAGRLQSLIDSRDYSRDLAELRFQLGKICDAVKSTVPQSMWAAIIEKLEELEQHPEALDVCTESFDDADDDAYDPTEFIDDDDDEF